jgi:hypothetical protein
MPNELDLHLEQRILAFLPRAPGLGPRRISAELAREKWGGLRSSPNRVWRVVRRQGLSTRQRHLSLVAGYATATSHDPRCPSRSGTSRTPVPESSSGSTASTSAVSQGRKARSASTRRSTSPQASPGRSCTPRRSPRAPGALRRHLAQLTPRRPSKRLLEQALHDSEPRDRAVRVEDAGRPGRRERGERIL